MQSCKILLLDDDEDDLIFMCEAFTSCGMDSVATVRSTKEAFNYLDENTNKGLPDVIVADVHLGADTGTDFLKQVKSIPKYAGIKVLIITTSKVERYSATYKELGAVDYIAKPDNYEDYKKLATELQQLLSCR
jgi:CheY-like chemotaxis protein